MPDWHIYNCKSWRTQDEKDLESLNCTSTVLKRVRQLQDKGFFLTKLNISQHARHAFRMNNALTLILIKSLPPATLN